MEKEAELQVASGSSTTNRARVRTPSPLTVAVYAQYLALKKQVAEEEAAAAATSNNRTNNFDVKIDIHSQTTLMQTQMPVKPVANAKSKKSSNTSTASQIERSAARNKPTSANVPSQSGHFNEHLSLEQVNEGIKDGSLISGTIRINQKNYEEAYVNDPSGAEDYLVFGLQDRNRAFGTDLVAIRPKPRHLCLVRENDELTALMCNLNLTYKTSSNNQKFKTVSQLGFDVPDKLVIKCAQVVCIMEYRASRVAVGGLRPFSNNHLLFSPNDPKIMRMLIAASDAPPGFHNRPQDFASVLFAAEFKRDWPSSSKLAHGSLIKELGTRGQIEPEIEGVLMQNGVDTSEYPEECTANMPVCDHEGHWNIPEIEISQRRDFRDECLFTIDPKTARDLDDALHIKTLPNGLVEIGVHIADVSYFVLPDTKLDKIAQERATSVYLVHKVVSMLPRVLCECLCSLNAGVDRLCMSVVWHMDTHANVVHHWMGRSIIRSCVKLSYEHAQVISGVVNDGYAWQYREVLNSGHEFKGFLSEPDREWSAAEVPLVSGQYAIKDIANAVTLLHGFACILRNKRFANGSLRIDQPKLSFTFNDMELYPTGCSVYERKDSNSLIEEFMLLANISVATRIEDCFPDIAMLRRHPPPNAKLLQEAVQVCAQLGVCLNGASSHTIHASLMSIQCTHLHLMPVITQLLMKPMQLAQYFCTGTVDDRLQYAHYALNVPLYTHFTSPIRRYPDIIVHRLLAASFDQCSQPPSQSAVQMQKLAQHCNDRKTAARIVSDFSSELFFAAFIEKCGSLVESGIVTLVQDHSFDVLITKYAITKRVYTDKMELSSAPNFTKGPPATLDLTFSNGLSAMCLTLGSDVTVTITTNKQSLILTLV